MQCEATAKSTGERCNRRAVTGKRVCWVHGGATPGGIASPQYKHGRYSKHLPPRLMERYQEAANDPQLLALTEEIALVDARLVDVLGRVDSGEAGDLWQALRDSWESFQEAQRGEDTRAMADALLRHDAIIRHGLGDWAAWRELFDLVERRRKLVESERKRLVEMQQTITVDRALLLVGAVVESVRRHVTDRKVLNAIQLDLTRILDYKPAALAAESETDDR